MNTISASARPTVVLVDGDSRIRRRIRSGLELDGANVVEAGSLAQARHLLSGGMSWEGVCGVVIDPELPDGDGLSLVGVVEDQCPEVPVIVVVEHALAVGDVVMVERGDVDSVLSALSLAGLPGPRRLSAADVVLHEADQLADDWRELCRWDPMLPPESQPPYARDFVVAVAHALDRPQPLGWGADPEIEGVTEVFAMSVGSIDVAVAQLVCLHEALRHRLQGRLPVDEEIETLNRMSMLLGRAVGVAAGRMATCLEQQAYVDPLTGLFNRRALDRDLRREMGRAARYGRSFGVIVVDVDGLKQVNDIEGHAAGDAHLRALATALVEALRTGDQAYRIGGDEFVVLLPETTAATARSVADRIRSLRAPAFTWGAASFPEDAEDADLLLDLADQRLFAKRRKGQPVR